MVDKMKRECLSQWDYRDYDVCGIGHPKRRNEYRKQQKRRARRVLKQELKKELW